LGAFSPQLADYDGDGLADLLSGCACCDYAFSFFLFKRQKDGGFAARQPIKLDYKGKFEINEFYGGGLQAKVAVTDWNGDGIPDLLVGGDTRVLGVAYGPFDGKKTVTVERVWPKGKELLTRMTTNLCVADWDGDGLADLIVGGFAGEQHGVYWLRNVGTKREPKLAEPKPLITEKDPYCTTVGVWVADWNADGRLDLIASRVDYQTDTSSYIIRQHKVWVYLRQAR
jgi:hypothetical protein